jgi:hypothetical protein
LGCITITVQALPSAFTAGAFGVSATTLDVGDTFTLSLPVSNTGGTSGVATVDFTAGGITQTKTATIAAGGTATLSASFTAATEGQLIVCGDLRQ